MSSKRLDEETRLILKRVIESIAWRQIASMNMLGHCLKLVVDLQTKLRVANELDVGIRLFNEVAGLYDELGWEEIETVVRDRIEDLPYPASRVEFGLAYYLTGLAEMSAMQSYTDCSEEQFAAIACSYVDASTGRPDPTRFIEFCKDPGNRPQAQTYVNRWLPIALFSLGRPGSKGEQEITARGLRSKTSAELQSDFLAKVQPFLESCGVQLPDLEELGVELGAN
ncbi:MAG: hypothetical protein ACI8PQ_002054 [Planctomycetota bacterium]|jgi:hypothetical protein